MPSVYETLKAVKDALDLYFTPASGPPLIAPAPIIFLDKASTQSVENLARAGTPLISLQDMRFSRNVTRWATANETMTQMPTGIGALGNAKAIGGIGGTMAVAISGAVLPNDAIGISFQQGLNARYITYTSVGGDTPASIATTMVGLINADSTLNTWLIAAEIPPVSVLTIAPDPLTAFGSATITVNSLPAVGQSVYLSFTNGSNTQTVGWKVRAGDTTAIVALGLLGGINLNTSISGWVTGSPSGNVINLTSTSGVNTNITEQQYPSILLTSLILGAITVTAKTGNIANRLLEVGRRVKAFLFTLYTMTEDDRDTYGPLLEGWLFQRSQSYGIPVPPNMSWARIMPSGDDQGMDTHMPDIYRWDFRVDSEIGVEVSEVLYSVLGIQPGYDLE